MTEAQFWEIIERSRQGSWDCQLQAERLKDILCELTPAQIIAFDHHFLLKRIAAYRWDLWDVAHLICDGCSDDGFEDFRRWLVGQGRQAFERALRDPESIIDVLESTGKMKWIKANPTKYVQCEILPYASCYAYETLTGEELPHMKIEELAAIYPYHPIGERFDYDDLPNRFLRVAQIFCKTFET